MRCVSGLPLSLLLRLSEFFSRLSFSSPQISLLALLCWMMSSPRVVGSFTVWDYVVFAGMLLISATIGVYYAFAGGGQKTSKDFLMGGRSMTAVPVALSLAVSFISAITVLAVPAEIYRFGAMFSVFAISYTFVVIISSELYLPVFYKLGITSSYEYLELRFNKLARLLGTILFIIQMSLYNGIVIYAPALALNQVTGFNLWGAVVSTGTVCTFYCTLGGLKAVIWTDVFQIAIMIAGFAAVIIRAVVVQGGISTIINDSYYGGRLNFWESLYINLLGQWVILTCAVLSGLCLYSIYRDCDPLTSKTVSQQDQLMPYLVMDILQDYPGLPGLFVACVYSGTLSTVSSSINALATVTLEDLIKPCFPSLSENTVACLSKCLSLFFGVLCIAMAALASVFGGLLQAGFIISGIIGGPILGMFSLGMFSSFTNSKGAISGLILGFTISLWVAIGAHLYPPLPERTLPLKLSLAGCNVSEFNMGSNWTSTTELPTMTSLAQKEVNERPALADSWYSLSYQHYSTLGTLVTVTVGLIVSLLTGGRKQNINCDYLLTKEDLFCSHCSWLKQIQQRMLMFELETTSGLK
ncbi:sodium-coupled monocarboxylate transporter 1 isoform X2 [Microcaecilia unicolor]|uniref:Sodium-coupled monocarboxylate transporter 1-like isoform X2 n=1 Tax=Microcaecilia unicolor TaxID=1415580 RepID=A0A6P7YTK7_9AMPH|nr:sodium-coupled monocarboxylate transporter 1-like isoform X2 [Microcaecilia unicolor]